MNEKKFLDLLKKFNGGILRGSQRKLSKDLKIDESSIANFRRGRQIPSEKLLKEMAKILKTTEEEMQNIFEINTQSASDARLEILEEKMKRFEVENALLKKEIELIKIKISK